MADQSTSPTIPSLSRKGRKDNPRTAPLPLHPIRPRIIHPILSSTIFSSANLFLNILFKNKHAFLDPPGGRFFPRPALHETLTSRIFLARSSGSQPPFPILTPSSDSRVLLARCD